MAHFETKPDGTRFSSSDYSPQHATAFAHRYDDGLGDLKIAAFRRLAGPLDGVRVLDVGSGEGTFSNVAQRSGARAFAIDFAASMVEATARRTSVPVVRGSADALPYADDSFDLLIALDIIEHLYEPEIALREFRRVLVPGGRLLLGTDREGVALALLPLRFPKPIRRILSRRPIKGTLSDRERYLTPMCTHTHEFELGELLELTARERFRSQRIDSYSYSLELNTWARVIERVAIGPLRKYKWNYVMIALSAA